MENYSNGFTTFVQFPGPIKMSEEFLMNEHATACSCLDCHKLELGCNSSPDQGFTFSVVKHLSRDRGSEGKFCLPLIRIFSLQLQSSDFHRLLCAWTESSPTGVVDGMRRGTRHITNLLGSIEKKAMTCLSDA